jgi:hypothetical protein
MFKQYQYDKYEKVEFDMNTIDSAMMKSKLFKGMEFVFKKLTLLELLEKPICQFLSMNLFQKFMATI